jgi:ATP-binding cassette subfamily A (ABC1) protein 3
LKNGESTLKEREITDLLTDLGLAEHKLKVAASLSEGIKRKVSVAIALCGKSTLVLLDEPTAGMDQNARRSLWSVLQNYRRDRIIILTT